MESEQCDFETLSDNPCDKIHYVRNTVRKNLSGFEMLDNVFSFGELVY